tara:strand:+ start:1722 stop:2978 length:1257 start_codon:yes stop_codon:yes gene_type:complete
MATRYPGALDRDPNEIPDNIGDSDTLDSPNHATIHNNVNGAVLQIEEKLGIGDTTASAGALLHGTAAGTSAWSADPSVVGSLSVAKDSADAVINLTAHHDTEATAAELTLRKSDGSKASPALVDDNAVLGKVMFQGYDGNSYATGAVIQALADGTPADGDMPTELVFQVTPDGGSETPVTALTIKPTGESRFTADNDITDFTADNHGVVTLFNTDGAVDDFTCLDFIGNGVKAAGRIAFKYTGGGGQIHFGVSNTYGDGITHTCLTLSGAGNVAVAGALSKGSGTFDIAHPTRSAPWRLRHSFIEGPKADLIYRGAATIGGGGTVAVDLDTASGLTDGTWQALNQDPWSMVTSSGNAVTWALSGKTLTITGPAGAVCQWLVIGERKDQTVIDWEATDSDGHLITEYDSSVADTNDAFA